MWPAWRRCQTYPERRSGSRNEGPQCPAGGAPVLGLYPRTLIFFGMQQTCGRAPWPAWPAPGHVYFPGGARTPPSLSCGLGLPQRRTCWQLHAMVLYATHKNLHLIIHRCHSRARCSCEPSQAHVCHDGPRLFHSLISVLGEGGPPTAWCTRQLVGAYMRLFQCLVPLVCLGGPCKTRLAVVANYCKQRHSAHIIISSVSFSLLPRSSTVCAPTTTVLPGRAVRRPAA